MSGMRTRVRALRCAVAALLCAATTSRAEHLPLATYTTAQGLAGNDVVAAVEDARGFLWLGTERGLSRFDGREFRKFGKDHGLADERITALIPASDDAMWVGTWSAVYRFEFRDGRFTSLTVEGRRRPWERTRLVLDRDGRLWCGADGLYRAERIDHRFVLQRVEVPSHVSLSSIAALASDAEGNLWMAADEVYRRRADGRFDRLRVGVSHPSGITSLAVDPRQRLWITAVGGFWIVDGCAADIGLCRSRRVLDVEVIPWVSPLFVDGGAWLGTSAALVELDSADRVRRRLSRDQGLLVGGPTPLLRDQRGDLWIGIGFSGLQRLAADGFTAFGEAEGLEAGLINAIQNTRDGQLVVSGHPHVLQRLDGQRFRAVRPAMPPAVVGSGWGWYQVDLQDRSGQWWISTQNGVVRWPSVATVEDLAQTPAIELIAWRGCFRGQDVFRLYEDSRSDLWIGTIESGRPSLHRWNRRSGTIDCFSTARFLDEETAPTAFLDDGHGTLWIGFYRGEVARYRDGRFQCAINCASPSLGIVTSMLLDHRRRLWIATHGGVFRVDEPEADTLSAIRLTMNDGLASNRARAVLEDRFNRIYIGSDVGVDVLDPDGAAIRHYGVEDGLPHHFINMAQTDRNGDLWFGTLNGLARWTPKPLGAGPVQARVFIDRVRVAGVARDVAASAQQTIDGLVLNPDQRNLQVDFVALPRDASPHLVFEYRLSDDDPWSPVSSGRSILLGGLAAGSHRLEIRALDAGRRPSSQTAAVSFRVLAPVYRRGWFLAVVVLGIMGVASATYRWRIAHLAALERQRTRIAMDLHDEMGSRLGSIGLLADVAAENASLGPQRERLEHIAETAAELGSSLAEIVWSLRPGAMTLEGVAQHLAVHGRRLFPCASPVFETHFPDRWPAGEMSPIVGRAVLLIGLEALHNCARHARARTVVLELGPSGWNWLLRVEDDGRGMVEGESPAPGFGLETMRRRAADIDASLKIESRPGGGSSVCLSFSPRAAGRRRIE